MFKSFECLLDQVLFISRFGLSNSVNLYWLIVVDLVQVTMQSLLFFRFKTINFLRISRYQNGYVKHQ